MRKMEPPITGNNSQKSAPLNNLGKERSMEEMLKDPVCGKEVTYETAQARSEYHGQTYYFDSLDCKEQFDRDPEKYVSQEREARP
jgi:YHS domain-containing protein